MKETSTLFKNLETEAILFSHTPGTNPIRAYAGLGKL